jgi:hypothetical protein
MKKSTFFAAITAITLSIGNAQPFLNNGLLAYYPFSGNANDAVGTNNGTVVGATLASDRFGNPNQAYAFNGSTTNYIVCPDAGFPAGNSARTISIWIYFRSSGVPTPDNPVFVCYGGGQQNDTFYGILMAATCPNNAIAVGQSGGNGCGSQIPQFPGAQFNRWYHVVFSHDGANTRLYVDGLLRGTAARTYGTVLDGNFYVGSYTRIFAPPNSPDAVIDEVRVYNRTLSTNEVAQLYQYESGPWISVLKAVKPSFSNLTRGINYQLQVSGDMSTWTNQGSPFIATNSAMIYPQYWDVDNWGRLFFRLSVLP